MSVTKIRIDRLTKSFGEANAKTQALADFTLTVAEGEFICVVGPSGCGKTTVLRIVAGLEKPTSGTVNIRPSADANRPQNAMVFQEHGLFPWMTVEDNVAYSLEMRGVDKRERRERVAFFLDMIGLTRFRRHYPQQLSGGMRQRVSLARALMADPEILLMDEPFAALDAQTREHMQAELLKIWAEARKTVLFITHQINEAVYLADRVAVLSGRPGHVKDIFPIPFGRPRPLSVKRDPQFLAIEDAIWRLVEEDPERIGLRVAQGA